MTDEQKKLQKQVEYTPQNYVSQYDSQVKDLYGQLANRPKFEYNAEDDQMYKAYLDRYQQLGKQAMRDSAAQTAALTGGYGNSYGAAVGQQTYDQYMQGANDKALELYQMAYGQYQDEGEDLLRRYGLAADLEGQEYARYQDSLNRQNTEYAKLTSLISATGYMPGEAELKTANMDSGTAKALQMQWAAQYPQLAFNQGIIDAEDFYAMTGKYPAGYSQGGNWYAEDNSSTEHFKTSEARGFAESIANTGGDRALAIEAMYEAGNISKAQRDYLRDMYLQNRAPANETVSSTKRTGMTR